MELEGWAAVQSYGAQAVFGRPLTVREMRHMRMAKEIAAAYTAKTASDNWADWAQKNPQAEQLLDWAMGQYGERRRDTD